MAKHIKIEATLHNKELGLVRLKLLELTSSGSAFGEPYVRGYRGAFHHANVQLYSDSGANPGVHVTVHRHISGSRIYVGIHGPAVGATHTAIMKLDVFGKIKAAVEAYNNHYAESAPIKYDTSVFRWQVLGD